MKISLVIPMYNESAIIEEAIRTFSSYMEKRFADWELIFVDDGSADGCGDAVTAAHEKDERIRLCRYTPNRGKGYAVRTGVLAAQGDIILFTDCDNAYGEEAVGRLAEAVEGSGADIVVGSRNLQKDGYEGYTLLRKLASKAYIKVIAIAAGFKLSDSQCGIKGFRADIAKKIFSHCEVDRFAFDLEVIMIATKLGAKIGEMPVKVINHRESTVHVLRDSVKMLRDVHAMKKRIKKQNIQ
ncbi:MAG: glycosyltransferase [Clostridia bacterium]|nr:glycosyltransferase [Clostridia bacterium]MBR6743725.1 glycosyltransferase [Clostridia bacterium]